MKWKFINWFTYLFKIKRFFYLSCRDKYDAFHPRYLRCASYFGISRTYFNVCFFNYMAFFHCFIFQCIFAQEFFWIESCEFEYFQPQFFYFHLEPFEIRCVNIKLNNLAWAILAQYSSNFWSIWNGRWSTWIRKKTFKPREEEKRFKNSSPKSALWQKIRMSTLIEMVNFNWADADRIFLISYTTDFYNWISNIKVIENWNIVSVVWNAYSCKKLVSYF